MGRREIPQGQKIKKLAVGKFRKAKSTKNRPSGNSASPKNQKVGRREIPQGQKIKKLAVGKFRKRKIE